MSATSLRHDGGGVAADLEGSLVAGAAVRQGDKEIGPLSSVPRSDSLGSLTARAHLHRSAADSGCIEVQTTGGGLVEAGARTLAPID